MITLVIALAGFLFPLNSAVAPRTPAQLVSSANIPLEAPTGWNTTTSGPEAMAITPGDVSPGLMYSVVVTRLRTRAGTLDEVYEAARRLIADVGAYTPSIAPTQAQSDGGWDYKFTIGFLARPRNALLAQVFALKKGDIGGIVIVLSDSVTTMQRYSVPFTTMIRSVGRPANAPIAPIASASARRDGPVDLQYTVPSGWTETRKADVTVIEASKETEYDHYRWTLLVFPSQPLKDSLRVYFADYWKHWISAEYESSIMPLPLMVRLSDGYACAFDADDTAKHKVTGAKPTAALYLLAHGDRFVPMMAIIYGYDRKIDEDFGQFIETARIPGLSSAKIPLFSSADITGDWSASSSSIASYVTSSGAYAGDASIYAGSGFNLRPDGTYQHVLVAISGRTRIKETDEGKWSIDDNELVLTQTEDTSRYSLLGYGVDSKAGRFLVLGPYRNLKAKVRFSNPRGPFQANWFKANDSR